MNVTANSFEVSNTTATVAPVTRATIGLVTVVGSMSISLNTICIYLLVRNGNLRKQDYVLLVINRFLVDVVGGLSLTFLQPFGVLWPDSTVCIVAAVVEVSTLATQFVSEFILVLNRYLCVCRQSLYERVAGRRRTIWLACAVAWAWGCLASVINLLNGTVGKMDSFICVARLDRRNLPIMITTMTIFTVPPLSAGAMLNFRIFVFIRKYQHQQLSRVQKSKLMEDRQMLVYLVAITAIPMLNQFPSVIISIISLIDPTLELVWWTFGAGVLFGICPILYPLLGFMFLPPLRDELLNVVRSRSWFRISSVTPLTAP